MEVYEFRNKCIFCEEKVFVDCFDIINTINYTEDLDVSYNENEIINLNFVGCVKCGGVQLKNLFDPNLIYGKASHCTENDEWVKHNNSFISFIKKNIIKNNKVIEIGGGLGKFAKNAMNEIKTIDSYKILEIGHPIKNVELAQKIEFLEGNCEDYNFNELDVDTIIMSHVFEHLYDPKKFVKNISNANIKEIFIAIPHMEVLMENGDINNLNVQHTFYIDAKYIASLFNEFSYSLNETLNYADNSLFFYFKKNFTPSNFKSKELYANVNLIKTLDHFYNNLKEKISKIDIDHRFFICPSGFYGKIVYYYLKEETKKNVIGFLDGDKNKINKRLSGTNHLVYHKEFIQHRENVTILLISEKYKEKLIEELDEYNKSINFLIL